MQQLVLNIEEPHYAALLQYLKSLDYVRIVRASHVSGAIPQGKPLEITIKPNQLVLLKQILQRQSRPLFQKINDPVDWQKKQRDEWS